MSHTHGSEQPQKSSQPLKHPLLLNSLVSFKHPKASVTSVGNSQKQIHMAPQNVTDPGKVLTKKQATLDFSPVSLNSTGLSQSSVKRLNLL